MHVIELPRIPNRFLPVVSVHIEYLYDGRLVLESLLGKEPHLDDSMSQAQRTLGVYRRAAVSAEEPRGGVPAAGVRVAV